MITALDHIAIAVPDLEGAIARFLEDFGLQHDGNEVVAGPIATYLQKRGGGLHHLCFRTDDIDADVERLRAKGYQFTSDAPTPGAHGSRVIFIHPKSCDGVLIELSQPAESRA